MQAICVVQVSRFEKSKFFFCHHSRTKAKLVTNAIKAAVICYGTENDFDKVDTENDNYFFILIFC